MDMKIMETIRAAFTTQEQVYLSWPVLLMSLYTVNSSLNMSVMPLYLALEGALIAGGCHEILVRCCSGAKRRLEAKTAHVE